MTLELAVEKRQWVLPISDVENVSELNSIKPSSNPASYSPEYIGSLYKDLTEKDGVPPELMSVTELNECRCTHRTIQKEEGEYLFPPSGSVVFKVDENCGRIIVLGRISSEPFVIESTSFQRVFITPAPDDEEAHITAKEEILTVGKGIETNEFVFLR